MYGAAPKTSRVASQVEFATNCLRPVYLIAGPPMRHSSATISAATTRTAAPSRVSTITQARSGTLARERARAAARSGSRATSVAGNEDGLSIHRHSLQRLLHLLEHGAGKRRVVQRRSVLLPLVLGPPDELE